MTTEAGSATPLVNSTLLEEGTLLRLMLDRPKANILTLAMMNALSEALSAHKDNPHLRLVVIHGAGNHFSFGASVEEHQKEQAPSMLTGFHAMIRQVAGYPVPIAALVEGSCLGGAFELILACHLVFASPTASFGCPEIKLGVFYKGIVTGCSCADDPTPNNESNEYCVVQLLLDKEDASVDIQILHDEMD